ncbi:MAG: hypothetical protein JW734_06560 [Candidatus Omnitrophica bacterium]|nr:hypothetical protein [Candidatus Omnitrophota bacterium]
MTNAELSVHLTLRDKVTKQMEGIKGRLQQFANSFKQNWLAITAALTAAFMAIRKAWQYMELGAKAEQIEQSFQRMAESVGINAQQMRKELMEVSKATVNFSNVADKVSALMAQGLNMQTITSLMRQARVEARIFGTTTEEAFQNITSAVTGGLVTTLRRSYGLQLSLKDAAEEYARATGKTTEEVQKFHMAQALANHILERSKSHLEAVNLEMMTSYEKVQMLKSRFNDFAEKTGQVLWHVLGFIQGFISHIATSFLTLAEWIYTGLQKLLVPVTKLYELLSKLPGQVGEAYRAAAEKVKELSTAFEQNKDILKNYSSETAKYAMEQYDLVFAHVEETGDNTAQALKNAMRVAGEGMREETQKIVVNVKETFEEQIGKNILRNFYNNAVSGFQTFFSDVLKGQLKTLQDYFKSFTDAVLNMIANVIAQLLVAWAIQAMFPQGGWVRTILGFHEGGEIEKKHMGGLINAYSRNIIRAHRGLVPIRAHAGLAPDEVPIIAQTGEGVLSRRGMSALGEDNLRALNRGGSLGDNITYNYNSQPVAVFKVWDFADIMRHKQEIQNIIAEAVVSNAPLRGVIKNYA